MNNDMQALYGVLFDTLRGLRDRENPLEIERAEAVSGVAQTIINAAKLEIDYQRVSGNACSAGLLQGEEPVGAGTTGTTRTATGSKTVTLLGHGATATTHRLR